MLPLSPFCIVSGSTDDDSEPPSAAVPAPPTASPSITAHAGTSRAPFSGGSNAGDNTITDVDDHYVHETQEVNFS